MGYQMPSIRSRIAQNARLSIQSLKDTRAADKAMGARMEQRGMEEDANFQSRLAAQNSEREKQDPQADPRLDRRNTDELRW
jgi:ERCC4-type nuclease